MIAIFVLKKLTKHTMAKDWNADKAHNGKGLKFIDRVEICMIVIKGD